MTELKHWRIEREPGGLAWLIFDKAEESNNTPSTEALREHGLALDALGREPLGPRRRRRLLLVALAVAALITLGYAFSLDPLRPQTIGKEQRCPVCGMYPALSPRWATQIVFADRGMIAFDSLVEMLRYLHDLPRYGKGRIADEIARIYVSDHLGGGWLRAELAFFVAGSRVRGPMREVDYPAFATREAAEAFARSEGGELRSYMEIAAQPPRPHEYSHEHPASGH